MDGRRLPSDSHFTCQKTKHHEFLMACSNTIFVLIDCSLRICINVFTANSFGVISTNILLPVPPFDLRRFPLSNLKTPPILKLSCRIQILERCFPWHSYRLHTRLTDVVYLRYLNKQNKPMYYHRSQDNPRVY